MGRTDQTSSSSHCPILSISSSASKFFYCKQRARGTSIEKRTENSERKVPADTFLLKRFFLVLGFFS